MNSLLLVLALLTEGLGVGEHERPNILWITSEDNSFHWLGCYGGEHAHTPNLDQLAAQGVRYKYGYANAPVCAVARFTLITGRHAPSMGCQNMRSRYPIPPQFKPYPAYLREVGYYCTNNSKTDYNFATDDKSHWDECGGSAHWRKRPEGKPFFAVFNTTITHESSLFEAKTESYRESGAIPKAPRVDPAALTVPPYLPDTAEIRRDWVTYLDIVTAMDAQVGKWLTELEAAGEAENTIVFYYSDHGGVLPRAKRYLYDTGTHVPMIVRVPEKWAHLAPGPPGAACERLVSFIDLPPTALSLAGVEIPKQMRGRAFLGEQEQEAEPYVFLYGQRFDARMVRFVRAMTDGRYRYLRNFNPHLHRGIFAGYPHGQAGWRSFYAERKAGTLTEEQSSFWATGQPIEELYDTRSDPWEVKNLAEDPMYGEQLAKMRAATLAKMREIRDAGIVPESMYGEISANGTVYDYVNCEEFPYDEILDLALVATEGRDLNKLQAAMNSEHPVERYWGAVGCTVMGPGAATAAAQLRKLLDDPELQVRIAASEALATVGDRRAAVAGLTRVMEESDEEMTVLAALNAAEAVGVRADIDAAVLRKATSVKGYPERMATPIE